jgi:Fic family protein
VLDRNAAFVPPPAKLEGFLHDQPETTPALLKAALAHVQSETIHLFLDGNGRLGRLLITLLL